MYAVQREPAVKVCEHAHDVLLVHSHLLHNADHAQACCSVEPLQPHVPRAELSHEAMIVIIQGTV